MTGLPATLGASDENYRRLGVGRDYIEPLALATALAAGVLTNMLI